MPSERETAGPSPGWRWSGLGVPIALWFGLAALYPIDNADTFGHLAAGREILRLGQVPKLDPFSFFRPTPQPWLNYEWLSDLLYGQLFAVGGYTALIGLSVVCAAALGVCLLQRAQLRAGRLGAGLGALLLLVGAATARFRFSVRPDALGTLLAAFSLLGLSALLEALRDPRQRGVVWRWVIALGVVHIAWVNLHGSHLLGLSFSVIVLATQLRERAARTPLLVLLGLQLMASCLSPYGPQIVIDAVAHLADPAYRTLVDEWQAWSTDKPLWLGVVVVLQSVLLLLAAPGLRKDNARVSSLLIAGLLALMALRSLRFIPTYLLLTTPLVAEGLAPRLAALSPARLRAGAALASALLLSAALAIAQGLPPGARVGLGLDLRHLPAASAAWLAQHKPAARVFGAMEDSWYTLFAAPHVRVLVDGRAPFYKPAHLIAMSRAFGAPNELEQILGSYQVDSVILQYALDAQQPALRTLEHDPAFQLVMIEDAHALFVRPAAVGAGSASGVALRVLEPAYDPAYLLRAQLDERGAREELSRLSDPNSRGYRAFTSALLSLRPLVRAEGRAGFSAPHTASEESTVRAALVQLRAADDSLPQVPVVMAYHALIATLACQLGEAHATLTHARAAGGDSRETLLTGFELSVREGHDAELQQALARAQALPGAAADAWLAALRSELDAKLRCPNTQ